MKLKLTLNFRDEKGTFGYIYICIYIHESLVICSTIAILHPLLFPNKSEVMLSANNNNILHDAGELLASGADGMCVTAMLNDLNCF